MKLFLVVADVSSHVVPTTTEKRQIVVGAKTKKLAKNRVRNLLLRKKDITREDDIEDVIEKCVVINPFQRPIMVGDSSEL